MAEVRWATEAAEWLKNIHDYIAERNPTAAASVVGGIYERIQLLRTFPEMGYILRSEREGEIRVLQYGHYRIAYILDSGEDAVVILGVFHGSLDIDRYL